jgi:hypothetical protein
VVTSALAVAHIGLLAVWLGSMLYSLLIVQPRAARFFAADDDTLEEFLTVLGSGNRRPVVGIVVALFITGGALVAAIDPTANQAGLFATEGILLLVAAAVFARVSWRLWPRRVFALPGNVERFDRLVEKQRRRIGALCVVRGNVVVLLFMGRHEFLVLGRIERRAVVQCGDHSRCRGPRLLERALVGRVALSDHRRLEPEMLGLID